jgi:hypothetical protein
VARLRGLVRALPILVLVGCSVSSGDDIATAQHRYLAAKAECVSANPDSLAREADCRTRAANRVVRPYYRYGDLMDYAQATRRELAVEVDRHELSRAEYDRRIARSERDVAREEDRRNALAHVASSYRSTPFTPLFAAIGGMFR